MCVRAHVHADMEARAMYRTSFLCLVVLRQSLIDLEAHPARLISGLLQCQGYGHKGLGFYSVSLPAFSSPWGQFLVKEMDIHSLCYLS